MQVSRRTAGAALRRTFADHPLAIRAHVLGRFNSCPFLRTLHHVTPGARVLDVGGGHGLYAVLALLSGAASVTSLDPDLRKTLGRYRDDRVHFVAGFSEAVAGRFDLITLFDVLYRVPIEDRDALFALLRDRLRPGGKLLIKELDPEHRLKSAWNRIQEWLSDGLLGITMGAGFYYETSSRLQQRMEAAGLVGVAVENIGAGYPHAHVTYTALAPPTYS